MPVKDLGRITSRNIRLGGAFLGLPACRARGRDGGHRDRRERRDHRPTHLAVQNQSTQHGAVLSASFAERLRCPTGTALPVLHPYSPRTWSKLDIGWTGG